MKSKRNCEWCGKEHSDGPYQHKNTRVWQDFNLCKYCYHKWASPESFAEIVAELLASDIKRSNASKRG